MRFKVIVFLIVCCAFYGSAQTSIRKTNQKKTDSLAYSISLTSVDSKKLDLLNQLTRQYMLMADMENALKTANQAKEIALELDSSKSLSLVYNYLGNIFYTKGETEQAIENYKLSLELRKKNGDKKGIAGSYNNIGLVYHIQGDYEKAIENHLNSLFIKEEIGDTAGMASCFTNIGNVFLVQKNYSKALYNYKKSLDIDFIIGNKFGIAQTYSNIGIVYNHMKEYTNAMKNLSQSLLIRQTIDDQRGIAEAYINIANVYEQQLDYEKALGNQMKAMVIYKKIDNKQGVALAYKNSGILFTALNKLTDAENFLYKSLAIDKEFNNRVGIKECYEALSTVFYKKADYSKAYEYKKMFELLKDSLLSKQSVKQIAEMNERYNSIKKDKEITQKETLISKQQADTEKKQAQINVFIICCVLLLIFAILIFRAYRSKQFINKQLQEKSVFIEEQKNSVEEKNKKITSSIAYAKRIQKAVIPSEEKFKTILPNSFILFKPKDVVSGDFYWISELDSKAENNDSKSILLAVGDCVGHGVPGALMSLMSYNLLEQIVKDHKNYRPSLILNDIAAVLTKLLLENNDKSAVKSGLDIALCKIDFTSNVLQYSGAQNSLYLIRDGVLIEHKADKRSIPGKLNSDPFTNQEITVLKDDIIYLFTDGYADQKGGEENKKLFYKPFQELLMRVSHLPLSEQKKELDSFFTKWQGSNEQIDDVLVVGIKI